MADGESDAHFLKESRGHPGRAHTTFGAGDRCLSAIVHRASAWASNFAALLGYAAWNFKQISDTAFATDAAGREMTMPRVPDTADGSILKCIFPGLGPVITVNMKFLGT
jgi:hypothetical protein